MKPSLNLPKNLLDKSKTYVVAVSFGPDSMALLSLLLKHAYHIHVAHVNYHKRDESKLEQSQLEQFCLTHDIPLFVLDATHTPKGNFQHEARTIRYDFFYEVAQEVGADAILTAHHQDDDFETALMQMERGGYYDYYGIKSVGQWRHVSVIRPLLSFTKLQLLNHCRDQAIPYGLDASNQKSIYTRNRMRKTIATWDVQTIQAKREAIQSQNESIAKLQQTLLPFITKRKINNDVYLNWKTQEQFLFWFEKAKQEGFFFPITQSFLLKASNILTSQKPNLRMPINKDWFLEKAYDQFWILNHAWIEPYRFKSSDRKKALPMIKFNLLELKVEHKVFMVRSAKPSDKVSIKNYQASFRRLAIDWKLPLFLRRVWPVLTTTKGKVFYIPHYHKNIDKQVKKWFEILE